MFIIECNDHYAESEASLLSKQFDYKEIIIWE